MSDVCVVMGTTAISRFASLGGNAWLVFGGTPQQEACFQVQFCDEWTPNVPGARWRGRCHL
jgi:hypothetical protein